MLPSDGPCDFIDFVYLCQVVNNQTSLTRRTFHDKQLLQSHLQVHAEQILSVLCPMSNTSRIQCRAGAPGTIARGLQQQRRQAFRKAEVYLYTPRSASFVELKTGDSWETSLQQLDDYMHPK